MRIDAADVKQHDKIMIDKAWWKVESITPPENGMRAMLISRGPVRMKLRLAVGQDWTVHRAPGKKRL